jgi:hypothetical protein
MKRLGRVCSTTLGLPCKKLHVRHRQIHGTVDLDEIYGAIFAFEDVEFGGQEASFFTLGEMLDMWARRDLKYELPAGADWPTKFVPKARFSYKHCVFSRYQGLLFTGKVVLSIPAGWKPYPRWTITT